jgi:MFS transporter, FSR family, fosmidomycin resistance protein
LGTLITALAGTYAMLMVGALLAGVGNSVFHPADFFILNDRVSEPRLGHAFSVHGVAGSLGFAAAPLFIGTLGGLYGWRSALLAAAAAGFVMVAILLANTGRLQGARAAVRQDRKALDLRVLLAGPVVLCFLYFSIYAAGWAGIQSFSVSAMVLQFGVGTTFAAVALTCYMVGSAAGMLTGGFIAARTVRHAGVAASGLSGSALTLLLVALGAVPVALLPVAFALAGFSAGCTAPSRDLIIRASTPPGATGRVYGFVYSGLDVGSLATPVFYGWLMDHHLPHAVFFAIAAFTGLAVLTVLNLPGKTRRAAAQGAG